MIQNSKFNLDIIKSTIISIDKILDDMESKGNINPFENELKILELYPEFYNMYPFLVKKICKRQNINMVYHMLDKLSEIDNGDNTLQHVEQELGQQLYDIYVSPNIKK